MKDSDRSCYFIEHRGGVEQVSVSSLVGGEEYALGSADLVLRQFLWVNISEWGKNKGIFNHLSEGILSICGIQEMC